MCYVIPNAGKRALQFGTITKQTHESEKSMKET